MDAEILAVTLRHDVGWHFVYCCRSTSLGASADEQRPAARRRLRQAASGAQCLHIVFMS